MSQTNIVALLRHHTKPTHERLHDHPLMVRHVLANIQPWSYQAFLSAFVSPWRDLHAQADRLVFSNGEVLGEMLPALGDALQQDIQALGSMQQPAPMTSMKTTEHVWGLTYTLVGSGMGAAVLYRQIKAQWPDAPTAYLDTARAMRVWPVLLKHLTQTTWTTEQQRLVIEGAHAGFEHVASHFDHVMYPPANTQSTR